MNKTISRDNRSNKIEVNNYENTVIKKSFLIIHF